MVGSSSGGVLRSPAFRGYVQRMFGFICILQCPQEVSVEWMRARDRSTPKVLGHSFPAPSVKYIMSLFSYLLKSGITFFFPYNGPAPDDQYDDQQRYRVDERDPDAYVECHRRYLPFPVEDIHPYYEEENHQIRHQEQ